MNIVLFSKALTDDGTLLPFLKQELNVLYAGCTQVLVITAASGDSDEAVRRATRLITETDREPVLLHAKPQPEKAIGRAAAIYVCGGNVFRLATALHNEGWLDPLRERVADGVPYVGGSAGAVVAGPSIATTNSMPLVLPPRLDALGLVGVHINVHYPAGSEQGLGETRENRILEVVHERTVDVLALRDGSALRVRDGEADVIGHAKARFFPRSGQHPYDLNPGTPLKVIGAGFDQAVRQPKGASS